MNRVLKFNLGLLLLLSCVLVWTNTCTKFTYLSSISFPPELQGIATSHLIEFNKHTNGSIIRQGLRPITIKFGELSSGVLGYTEGTPFKCTVTISNKYDWAYMPPIEFKSTLLHEIAHCYYFEHDPNPDDVMYYSESEKVTEESLINFYPKLEKVANY